MIKIKIKFFGIYKELFNDEIDVCIKNNSTLNDLKNHLLDSLLMKK
ncbi:MAG TPA: hypothetical protein ACYCC8_00420 [Candidatus Azoamicus sp.]